VITAEVLDEQNWAKREVSLKRIFTIGRFENRAVGVDLFGADVVPMNECISQFIVDNSPLRLGVRTRIPLVFVRQS